MTNSHQLWQLDSRLKADTVCVVDSDRYALLLMNDCRWPWLILVPKIPGAEELHDLDMETRNAMLGLSVVAGEKLKSITECEKINIAAIGNMVRQLHIHVVARRTGDANWPAPVWGFGTAETYPQTQADDFIGILKEQFLDTPFY